SHVAMPFPFTVLFKVSLPVRDIASPVAITLEAAPSIDQSPRSSTDMSAPLGPELIDAVFKPAVNPTPDEADLTLTVPPTDVTFEPSWNTIDPPSSDGVSFMLVP